MQAGGLSCGPLGDRMRSSPIIKVKAPHQDVGAMISSRALSKNLFIKFCRARVGWLTCLDSDPAAQMFL